MKKILVYIENFFYKVLLKNLLKTSRLGHGVVVTGAESGENFERIYNNRPEGNFLIGKFVDKALLNLPAAKATRGRKDIIKNFVWNEICNNKLASNKTRILDLASGGARYLRELQSEHNDGSVESVCIDKDKGCVALGKRLLKEEAVNNIKFIRGDIFKAEHLHSLSSKLNWKPNVIIASGLFIYFNNETVADMIKGVYDVLPKGGIIIFQSYESLTSRKLMRKTMSTSDGEDWTLYYRKPDYWRNLLREMKFQDIVITRDKWQMNNICVARK